MRSTKLPRLGLAVGCAVLWALPAFATGCGGGGDEVRIPDGEGAPSTSGPRVRVEVRNAGGRSGAAREATRVLRAAGFDVVWWGNAAEFGRDTSVVIARLGDVEQAERVAESLGIEVVREERDTTLYVDVTVLLGKSWTTGSNGGATDGETGREGR